MARHVKRNVSRGKQWEVRWSWYDVSGARRWGQQRFATHNEAKAKRAEIESKAVDSSITDATGGRETFEAWAERWFRDHSTTLKPSTARSYRALLDRSVLPAFGPRPIRPVSTADIQDFILGLPGRGLTPPTIRHHYFTVPRVFTYATQRRAIAFNPALGCKLPTDKSTGRAKREIDCLSEEEVAELAAHLTPPYDLLVQFMAYTGRRSGEVSGLNVGDLDLSARTVAVRRTRRKIRASEQHPTGWEVHVPKSGKARVVGLPVWLASELRAYVAAHPRSGDLDAPLWPGRTNGGAGRFTGERGAVTYDKPWERDAFYKRQFKPALAEAGLPASVRLHDLRHTAGSLMLRAGIEPYRVADYLGHSLDVLLRIYAHVLEADRTADMELLARPVRRGVTGA